VITICTSGDHHQSRTTATQLFWATLHTARTHAQRLRPRAQGRCHGTNPRDRAPLAASSIPRSRRLFCGKMPLGLRGLRQWRKDLSERGASRSHNGAPWFNVPYVRFVRHIGFKVYQILSLRSTKGWLPPVRSERNTALLTAPRPSAATRHPCLRAQATAATGPSR